MQVLIMCLAFFSPLSNLQSTSTVFSLVILFQIASQIHVKFQHLVLYEPTNQVSICHSCNMVISKERLVQHFQKYYIMIQKERKMLIEAVIGVEQISS